VVSATGFEPVTH